MLIVIQKHTVFDSLKVKMSESDHFNLPFLGKNSENSENYNKKLIRIIVSEIKKNVLNLIKLSWIDKGNH